MVQLRIGRGGESTAMIPSSGFRWRKRAPLWDFSWPLIGTQSQGLHMLAIFQDFEWLWADQLRRQAEAGDQITVSSAKWPTAPRQVRSTKLPILAGTGTWDV